MQGGGGNTRPRPRHTLAPPVTGVRSGVNVEGLPGTEQ